MRTRVLRSLAALRRERVESYVAVGVALNIQLAPPRRSRDIDLFHDTEEALFRTWVADALLREDVCFHPGSTRGAWPRFAG